MSKTPTYQAWRDMLGRCTNPANQAYPYYGGRGIRVCDSWLSFANFFADMGVKPPRMTIERGNNDGDYAPGNCRWATRLVQGRNKRSNLTVELQGRTMPLSEACELTGVAYWTAYARITRLGWARERAVVDRRDHRFHAA